MPTLGLSHPRMFQNQPLLVIAGHTIQPLLVGLDPRSPFERLLLPVSCGSGPRSLPSPPPSPAPNSLHTGSQLSDSKCSIPTKKSF